MIKLQKDIDIAQLINAIIHIATEKYYGYLNSEEEIVEELRSCLMNKINVLSFEDSEVGDLSQSQIFTDFFNVIFEGKEPEYKKDFMYQLVNTLQKSSSSMWNDSADAIKKSLLNFSFFQDDLLEALRDESFFEEYGYLYNTFLRLISEENALELMTELGVIDEVYIRDYMSIEERKKLVAFINDDSLPEIEKAKVIKVLGRSIEFETVIQILNEFEKPENILYALQDNFTEEKRVYVKTAPYTKAYDSIFKSLYNDLSWRAEELDTMDQYPKEPKMRMMYVLNYVLNARDISDRNCIGGPDFCESFQEDYYRMLLSRVLYYRDTMSNEEIPMYIYKQIEFYEKIKNELNATSSDEERKNIILNLNDNLLKQAFLEKVTDSKCREEIVDSLENEVDIELEEYVNVVQKMIIDFFEKDCGEKFTQEKREILNIVFAITKVKFEEKEAGTNGTNKADLHEISLNNTIRHDKETIVAFLIHEYGHALSRRNFFIGHNDMTFDLEEGFADVFSDCVINSYLENNDISINGKDLSFDKPHQYQSSYYVPNGKLRTLLYALEKEGKDIYPIIQEYFLGNKFNTLKEFFTPEKVQSIGVDFCGEPLEFDISFGDIYYAHKEALAEIDENNYWCQNNYLIAEILIEHVLEQNAAADSFDTLYPENLFNGNFISLSYFKGKEVYEITGEEIERYMDLVSKANCLDNTVITEDYSIFLNRIEELDIETIRANSLQIIDTLSGAVDMYDNEINEFVTRIVCECVNAEIEKSEDEKSVDIELKLYSLYNKLQKKLMAKKNEVCKRSAMKYINVGIENIIESLQEVINRGESDKIIDYITQCDSEFLVDARLERFLEENNIEIKTFVEKESDLSDESKTETGQQKDLEETNDSLLQQMTDKLLADILKSAISKGISLEECAKVIAQNPEIMGNIPRRSEGEI